MKQLLLVLAAAMISSSSFASINAQEAGQLWKNFPRTSQHLDKSDITMGYGGADLAHRPTASTITLA